MSAFSKQVRKRWETFVLTSISKKQLSAIGTGFVTVALVWNGKFGDNAWLAFLGWLTYVGAVHSIDLKGKLAGLQQPFTAPPTPPMGSGD